MFKKLATDKTFWVTFITLIGLVIAAANPEISLDPETWAAPIIVIVGYVLGVTIDPGSGPFFLSRKFWAAVVGLVFTALETFHIVLPFTIPAEMLVSMAVAVASWMVGIAIKDARA